MALILSTLSAIATFLPPSLIGPRPILPSEPELMTIPDVNTNGVAIQAASTVVRQQCSAEVLPYAALRERKAPLHELYIEGQEGGELYYVGVTHTSDPTPPPWLHRPHLPNPQSLPERQRPRR